MSTLDRDSRGDRRRRRAARTLRAVAAFTLLASAAACSTLSSTPRPAPSPLPAPAEPLPQPGEPTPAPPGAPSRPRSDTSAATQQLLQQSRAARAAGNYPVATATTERALRIDPNNAALWLELGEIALATGDTRQAETLARKALSLAAGDRAVTAQAERLLRAAGTR